MDTLISLKVFREVVELNSFSAAAKKLGISTAMASKHVAHLESTRHTRLLNRTSRNISLTETGKLYYASCQEALDILDDADSIMGQHNNHPRGRLRITAPQFLSNPDFARIVVDFQRTYPDIELELFLENQKKELVTAEYDLALRVTNNPYETFIARPLGVIDFLFVGTPDYFATHGYPTQINDFIKHSLILPAITHLEGIDTLRHAEIEDSHCANVIRTNDTSLILQLTRSSFGMAYLPYWLVARDLESKALLPVEGYPTESKTLYVLYKNRQFLAPKTRAFIDFLVLELGKLKLIRTL